MRHVRVLVVAVIVLASFGGLVAQSGPDKEASWGAFIAWFKAAPRARNPLAAYTGKLQGDGKTEAQAKQEIALLMPLLAERSDWIGVYFDISEQALVLSRANAQKAGVRVNAVNASYDSFDFGSNKWDLIVLAFAWAPVTDPAFVERLRTSLRPGGRIVFEHTIQNSPGPRVTKALMPNELRGCFSTFTIVSYEETVDLGDWGGPGTSLVRMVAVKQ